MSSSSRVAELALKAAQDILWANLPPSNNLADEAAVQAIRNIVRSPAVKSEIKRGSDTAPTFVLRATNQIVSDQFRAPADTITLLWGVLDQPYLNKLLGIPQNSRMKVGPKKPPAR